MEQEPEKHSETGGETNQSDEESPVTSLIVDSDEESDWADYPPEKRIQKLKARLTELHMTIDSFIKLKFFNQERWETHCNLRSWRIECQKMINLCDDK